MKIIFVCMGNTCRSPMAEAIYKKFFNKEEAEVISRGLSAREGAPAADNAIEVIKQYGGDLNTHRAKNISSSDFDADKIFCMTSEIYYYFISAGVDEEKLELLGGGIFDPYGGDLETYKLCAQKIYDALNN